MLCICTSQGRSCAASIVVSLMRLNDSTTPQFQRHSLLSAEAAVHACCKRPIFNCTRLDTYVAHSPQATRQVHCARIRRYRYQAFIQTFRIHSECQISSWKCTDNSRFGFKQSSRMQYSYQEPGMRSCVNEELLSEKFLINN